uniref:Rab-GAP TBC domain-containing protein n=1 Tax=Macrostomum lignano TaxID=282301 RepID=A0A1I8HL12_9PLAT
MALPQSMSSDLIQTDGSCDDVFASSPQQHQQQRQQPDLLAGIAEIDSGTGSARRSSTVESLLIDIYDRLQFSGGGGRYGYGGRRGGAGGFGGFFGDSSFESDTHTDTANESAATAAAAAAALASAASITSRFGFLRSGLSLYKQQQAARRNANRCFSTPSDTELHSAVAAAAASRKEDLLALPIEELTRLVRELKLRVGQVSSRLVRELKRRDHRLARVQRSCDLLTAAMHAASQKRSQDAKLKFTIEPKPGEDAFYQWRDGMRAVARLPNGIPVEFRRKVWLSLAEFYLASQRLDWQRIRKLCFNDRLNPDDDSLDHQIVKDLHRTGCEEFGSEHDRAVLKRVLLAYARWNKRVGYCQGFNVLAALILEVMERNEDEALKVMIFLVDSCLPESYFAQNLQALTVDMAVFRQLLRAHLPQLSNHLDRLQAAASAAHAASSPATAAVVYEPPLVNVFTIQWFLTLFSTCLPAFATLRLWDAIMLEGSEMLLRCALVLWRKLQAKILKEADSADAFYCHMGEITALLNSEALITTEQLIEELYASMSEIPSVAISELRERFTFNIKPFSAAVGGGSRSRSGKSAGRGGEAAFGCFCNVLIL